MTKYELIYILNTDQDQEAIEAAIEKFNGIITNQGGTVDEVIQWGKKRLAYEINDLKDGYYVLVNFTGTGAVVNELERIFKISEGILRHLVVKKA
ncbi:30S ribosomal protein S6 [Alkalicella caledoniensis]|uniref:Small ribosomal subunit protein bS6 n=1 Tax=Alkalicella caledoniensis TaxID=2731377 RepID=A0A7G9W8L3_ALKCA|nr:30S ribosomal protein S6 [Alkalicella caledoniensis]QNO15025.1 30S ribosomal protein S6 [Alkalicella caledoniensis]